MSSHNYASHLPLPQSSSGQVMTSSRPSPIQISAASDQFFSEAGHRTTMLSPPTTPVTRSSFEKPVPTMEFPPTPRTSMDERPEALPSLTISKTRKFRGKYNLSKRIGSGNWSDVHLAEEVALAPTSSAESDLHNVTTPPPSPGTFARKPSKLLAVKKPSRNDARRVLLREAKLLSFLQQDPASSSFVISFHGLDDNDSLVMDFAPLTLLRFAQQGLAKAKGEISTKTMYDPVVGETTWKYLAKTLISGLAWLHSRGIAHGDIKTENILLKRRDEVSDLSHKHASSTGVDAEDPALVYQPLFCDFSSARLVDDHDDVVEADANDATTTTYSSPELLADFKRSKTSSESPVDRQKADVWALAVSLAVAAVGTEPYTEVSGYVKNMVALNGDVLGSVRSHGQATRIMPRGLVANTVKLGLAKDPGTRVAAKDWIDKLAY